MPSFFKRLFLDPPVLFPAAMVFHLFLLVRAVVDFSGVPLDSVVWLSALWYAVAFVLTVFICLLRKWAAVGYIVLTMIGLILMYFQPAGSAWQELGTTLFPFDLLVSVFLFFFFKRFR